MFPQSLLVARSFPPAEAPEDEESENLGGDESDGEASVGDRGDNGDNADDVVVEQHSRNVEAPSDNESSPETDHGPRADDVLVPDAAPSASAPAPPKRSAGGFVDEDSLFNE